MDLAAVALAMRSVYTITINISEKRIMHDPGATIVELQSAQEEHYRQYQAIRETSFMYCAVP